VKITNIPVAAIIRAITFLNMAIFAQPLSRNMVCSDYFASGEVQQGVVLDTVNKGEF